MRSLASPSSQPPKRARGHGQTSPSPAPHSGAASPSPHGLMPRGHGRGLAGETAPNAVPQTPQRRTKRNVTPPTSSLLDKAAIDADVPQPTRSLSRRANAIVVLTFVFFLVVVGLLKLVWPEQAVSKSEHRALATRPALSFHAIRTGQYPVAFESYYNDQFPLRNNLIHIANVVRNAIRITLGDDVQIVDANTDMGGGDPNQAPIDHH